MQCAAHHSRRRAALFLLVAIIAIGFSLGEMTSSRAVAQTPDKPVDAPNPTKVNATSKAAQSQDLDDPATPLNPKKPRSKAEQKRLDALSWYLAGRIKESRNDFKGAYEDFKKAVELDPTAIKVYRELVPLAFRLNRRDDAVKFAFKAVKLDPEDYRGVMRDYQETVVGAVGHYDGHVAKYLGDGVLVYFGWPRAPRHTAWPGAVLERSQE